MSKIKIKVLLTENNNIIINDEYIGIKTSNRIIYNENDIKVALTIFKDKLIILRETSQYLLKLELNSNEETISTYKLKGYTDVIITINTKVLELDDYIYTEYYLKEQDKHYKFKLNYEVIK